MALTADQPRSADRLKEPDVIVALITAATLLTDPSDPNPNSTIVLDGTTVTVAQMKVLFDAFQSSRTSDGIEIRFDSKTPDAMPSYDPRWHYAGSTVDAKGVIHSEVWISKSVTSTHEAVVDVAAGINMAIMDSGFAGTYWKSFYDAEALKDKNDASRTGNPLFHRELVAFKIAEAMYSS